MKHITAATLILLMGTILIGAPPATEAGMTDLVVVDRTTRSKVLTDYTLLTRDAIQKAWKSPLDLKVPDALKGRVRINYTVLRSGALEAAEIIKGSGIPEMDHSLLNAIRTAQPFPPFPDDLRAKKILIRANFVVADLPAVPVTTVSGPAKNQRGWDSTAGTSRQPARKSGTVTTLDMVRVSEKSSAASAVAAPKTDPKKYVWGRPAGTARKNPQQSLDQVPAPPAMRRFEWGAGR